MITTNYSGNAISDDFIAAVGQPMVAYMCKLYDNGTALTCDIMRLSLTLGGCADPAGDADFAIGEVYASSMEATLYNVSGSLAGKELDVCIGVDIGSGVFEYVQVATVIVTSAKTRAGVTTVQAAGKLAYEATNTPLGVDGELAPSAVASAIATATGLTVTIGAFASTSTTVTVKSSMTCREALGAMAKRLGGFACETNDGNVTVAPFDGTATYTLDPGCMTALPDVEDADYEVDGITVQAAEDAYAYGTGRVEIADSDATSTTAAITWANVDGYAFRAGSANTAILDPRITPFDVLAVSVDGSTVNLPSRGISATYDGGYFGTFSAVGLTDAAEEALMKGPLAAQVDAAQQAADEALAVAEAVDQHFWPYADGAHVTGPDTQDEFLAAEAAGFPDYDPDTKPYHNILLNSLGILLRTALNNLVSITRSAIAFYDGEGNDPSNIVARFGQSGSQIGLDDESHIEQDYRSLRMKDKDGNTYFYVSDLRASSGKIEQTDTFTGDGSTTKFYLSYVSDTTNYAITMVQTFTGNGSTKAFTLNQRAETTDYTVSVGGSVVTSGVTKEETTVTFATAPANGAAIVVTYDLTYMPTFIIRYSTYIDFHPTIFGVAPLATCTFSITYTCSDDENKAFTFGSRAQGIVGASSASIGTDNLATGTGSIALGTGLITTSARQTVVGRYNSNVGGAVIVGGGTATTDRKNIARIDWSGNVYADGDIKLGSPGGISRTISSPSEVHLLASRYAATQYMLCVTNAGNLRMDKSTDAGDTWSTEAYFMRENSATSTSTTASNIAAAASGWSIVAASFAKWGKLGQLVLQVKSTSAISITAAGAITDTTVATLTSDCRPAIDAYFFSLSGDGIFGGVGTDGNVIITAANGTGSARSIAANTTLTLRTNAFILA